MWCDVSVPFCHFCSLEPGRVSVIIPCSLCYVKDIKQPSFPTPFYSVLVSIPFFMAFSTVFLSINSPDNSPPSHCSSRLNSALSQFRALFLLPASHIQLTQGKLNLLFVFLFLPCTQLDKDDFLENLHVFFRFRPIKKRFFNLLCALDLNSTLLGFLPIHLFIKVSLSLDKNPLWLTGLKAPTN